MMKLPPSDRNISNLLVDVPAWLAVDLAFSVFLKFTTTSKKRTPRSFGI